MAQNFKKLINFDSVKVFFDSRVEWKKNGLLHRNDGPAVIESSGEWHWYLEGTEQTLDDYLNKGGHVF